MELLPILDAVEKAPTEEAVMQVAVMKPKVAKHFSVPDPYPTMNQ